MITESMIDAPRRFLSGMELGIYDFDGMREHMEECGCDISSWPDWAKLKKGHIAKSDQAIIIYSMMQAHNARVDRPAQTGAEQ